MKTIAPLITLLVFSLFLGCSDDQTRSSGQTGRFLDAAPVQGIHYQSGSREGLTNEKGEFTYRPDELIAFSLGNLEIGLSGAELIMTHDFFSESIDYLNDPLQLDDPDLDAQLQRLSNLPRLIQSLDQAPDDDSVIRLPQNLVFPDDFDLGDDSHLLAFLQSIDSDATLIDADTAQASLQTTHDKITNPLSFLAPEYSLQGAGRSSWAPPDSPDWTDAHITTTLDGDRYHLQGVLVSNQGEETFELSLDRLQDMGRRFGHFLRVVDTDAGRSLRIGFNSEKRAGAGDFRFTEGSDPLTGESLSDRHAIIEIRICTTQDGQGCSHHLRLLQDSFPPVPPKVFWMPIMEMPVVCPTWNILFHSPESWIDDPIHITTYWRTPQEARGNWNHGIRDADTGQNITRMEHTRDIKTFSSQYSSYGPLPTMRSYYALFNPSYEVEFPFTTGSACNEGVPGTCHNFGELNVSCWEFFKGMEIAITDQRGETLVHHYGDTSDSGAGSSPGGTLHSQCTEVCNRILTCVDNVAECAASDCVNQYESIINNAPNANRCADAISTFNQCQISLTCPRLQSFMDELVPGEPCVAELDVVESQCS